MSLQIIENDAWSKSVAPQIEQRYQNFTQNVLPNIRDIQLMGIAEHSYLWKFYL